MARVIRRPDPELEPEDVEEETDLEAEREKVLACIQTIENNALLNKYALCQSLVEYAGKAGPNGKKNESTEKFEGLAQWLEGRGVEGHSAETLRHLRSIGQNFTAADISAAEEAWTSFSAIYILRCHPEIFRDLLACLEGKRPPSLSRLKIIYIDEEIALSTAIRRRGKILVSDAKMALEQVALDQDKHAGDISPASVKNGQKTTEPSRRKQIQKLREEIKEDPELMAEVMKDPEVRDVAYEASLDARRKAREEEEESKLAGEPDVAALKILGDKARNEVEDWVTGLRDARDVSDVHDLVYQMAHDIKTWCSVAENIADGRTGMADEMIERIKGYQ